MARDNWERDKDGKIAVPNNRKAYEPPFLLEALVWMAGIAFILWLLSG